MVEALSGKLLYSKSLSGHSNEIPSRILFGNNHANSLETSCRESSGRSITKFSKANFALKVMGSSKENSFRSFFKNSSGNLSIKSTGSFSGNFIWKLSCFLQYNILENVLKSCSVNSSNKSIRYSSENCSGNTWQGSFGNSSRSFKEIFFQKFVWKFF